MATLNFKGKTAVWNHHLSVPYHTLEKVKESSQSGLNENENLIIEGDNLLALKALLPKYQGKIKCIYIDPPYNTGNEGWAYNDNVNNPIIKSWIGNVVGREGEDLVRHDKWVCMMTPRLKLLKELLSNDGLIFVSIGDDEVGNLRLLMDEIFHEDNFLASIARMTKRGGNKGDFNKPKKDYILCYFKDKKSLQVEMFGRDLDMDKIKWEEEEFEGKKRLFIQGDIPYREKLEVRKNQRYYIEAPDGSLMIPPGNVFPTEKKDGAKVFPESNQDKCWSWSLVRYLSEKEIGRFIFNKSNQSPFLDENGNKSNWTVYKKVFKDEKSLKKEVFIDFLDKFQNSLGTKAMENLGFDGFFDNPKPPELIEYIISIASDEDSIILDSFAGSGTTAHSVLNSNKDAEENRKFILIQIEEEIGKEKIAYEKGYRFIHEITRDRVKKVIKNNKLDIGFTYYKLGPSIDGRDILAGKNLPSWESLAKYVHYLATGKPIDSIKKPSNSWEIVSGTKNTNIFLIYKDNIEELKALAITRDWLELVKNNSNKKIVYAPACFLDKEVLDANNISFVQVPFSLFDRS